MLMASLLFVMAVSGEESCALTSIDDEAAESAGSSVLQKKSHRKEEENILEGSSHKVKSHREMEIQADAAVGNRCGWGWQEKACPSGEDTTGAFICCKLGKPREGGHQRIWECPGNWVGCARKCGNGDYAKEFGDGIYPWTDCSWI